MKKIIIIVLSICFILSADFVPLDRAKKVAENYYKNYAPESRKGNVITRTIAKKYLDEVTYYAFEFGGKNGFVIVTADDGLRTILGWSFDSGLCSEEDFYNMKNPFANRFEMYEKQIIEARKIGFVDALAQKEWKDIENKVFSSGTKAIVVPALVQSRWGQGYPYNVACPLDGGQATMNGCVALAMAQVMRYHQAPSNPMGSHSYMWTGAVDSGTQAVDYTASTYDYSLMPTLTSGYTTSAQRDEVSELCYEAGVSVNMDYGTESAGGSGAYLMDTTEAFKTHFNSWSDIFYVTVGTVTNETTQSANINSDLGNSRPVIWAGSGPDGGHCFILDGRTDDYQYHFNWGWEGSMDGWYKLNNLNPGTEFTWSQEAVFKIRVDSPPPMPWPYPRDFSGFVTNLEDAVLTWRIPDENHYSVLTGYILFRNDKAIAVLDSSARSYTDSALCQGNYIYYATATFTDPEGESHISQSKTIVITENNDFPAPVNVNAAVIGRTGIDLSWHKPYIGVTYFSDGFEDGSISDWTQKQNQVWGSAKSWSESSRWTCGNATSWPDAIEEGIHSGSYSTGTLWDTTAGSTSIFSPEFSTPAGATFSYYNWYHMTTAYPTKVYTGVYFGTWSEAKWNEIIANMQVVDTLDTVTEIDPMVKNNSFTITDAHTNTRVFFWYDYYDGFEYVFDDIILGYGSKGSVEPTEYQVYRNGSLSATVPRSGMEETWTDTGFADGTNDYFIRCAYPAGMSIPSNRAAVFMDANPKPWFLSEDISEGHIVDLEWFAPYSYPSAWYDNVEGEPDSWWDYKDSGFGYLIPALQNRTWFVKDQLYVYPVSLDSVAIAFYENPEEPWISDKFTFSVYEGTELVYGPSPEFTAVSEEYTKFALPSDIELSESWCVVVDPKDNTKGHPGILSSYTDYTYSETWIDTDHNGSPDGWFTVSSDSLFHEFWISCRVSSSLPAATSNGWITNTGSNNLMNPQNSITTKSKNISGIYPGELNILQKGILGYNIYKDDEIVLTTLQTNATVDVLNAGETSFHVTAVYSDPPGESAPSNVVTVTITSIEDNVPYETTLSQNYPNPFNPETNIRFSIAADTNVKLKIYNTAGQLVTVPVNKFMNKGSYNIVLNALKLSGGIYIYKLEADGKEFSKKMTLIK